MYTIVYDNTSGVVVGGLNSTNSAKIISEDRIDRIIQGDFNIEVVIDDSVYDRYTNAITETDYNILVNSDFTPTYTSSDDTICTVDDSGFVTFISNGMSTIYIDCGKQGVLGTSLTLSTNGGQTSDQRIGWADGYVAKDVNDSVDNAIAGTNASVSKKVFTTQDHVNGIYVRNIDNWAYQWVQPMTCISPWNNIGVNTRAGTLITRRHIIHAAHYPLPLGAILRFVDVNNVVHERTILAVKTHPDYSPYYPDIRIAVLDSDLPETISHCKLSPPVGTLNAYFSNLRAGHASLLLDKEEKALIADIRSIDTTRARFKYPTDTKRLEYSETVIGGDSGNPSFLIIDDELVLLSVHTYGDAGSGTFVGQQLDAINQLIVDVDTIAGTLTGYEVDVVDLSGFNSIIS